MMRLFFDLWRDRRGQDLVEYSLLLAFIVTVAVALTSFAHPSISTVLSKTDSNLVLAVTASS